MLQMPITQKLAVKFGLRWIVCSLGLWIASGLLGPERLSVGNTWTTVLVAGFFLALANMALKPLLVVLSFPAIIFTLGLFMLLLNGFMVLLVSWVYDGLYIKNFGVAIIAGIIIGLINFLVTKVVEDI